MRNENKLREISVKAAENASAALSKLVDQKVIVRIIKAEIQNVKGLSPVIGSEEIVAGIYLPITGEVKGAALLIFPRETAFKLSDMLVKRRPGTTRKLTELDESALKEVGNIISGNYFTVLSNMLQVKIIEHIPNFSFNIFGAIVEQIIVNFAAGAEKALVIEIAFTFEPVTLKGYFLLLFELEEIEAILEALKTRD
jgi:chemotaxis protein CheC